MNFKNEEIQIKRTQTKYNGYFKENQKKNGQGENYSYVHKNMNITKKTTWNDIKYNNNITNIEHPLYASIITKQEFEKEFSKLLLKLNGNSIDQGPPTPDCYFGFYVEINPVDSNLNL